MFHSSVVLSGLGLLLLIVLPAVGDYPIGDLNEDGEVGFADIQLLAESWLNETCSVPGCEADLDGADGVNMVDLSILANNWGEKGTTLIINEFMALNTSAAPLEDGDLLDEDGDSSDWIEIYNFTNESISLGGWYLTDDSGNLTKWRFPDGVTIEPEGYLVVFASGKDKVGTKLHTNFQLDVDGEYLALVESDGYTIAHEYAPVYPQQVANISYGLKQYTEIPADGYVEVRQYFSPATPGEFNSSAAVGIVADTKFSHDRGFYDVPFSVTVATETEGATIHYTTDGSAPTETYGTTYTGPISISTTTCLRAMAFKPGYISTAVDTHIYIFLDKVITQPANPTGFPTKWGSETADYQMDPDIVNNAAYKTTVKDDLKSIPTMSIVMALDDLFGSSKGIYANPTKSGVTWERAGSIELIYPDESDGFQINCGVRMYGDVGRNAQYKKHAFRVLFKSIYGSSKLRYPLFGPDAAQEFDTLILRSNFNDAYMWDSPSSAQFIRDEYSRRLQSALGTPSSHGLFVHLYINGLYWGLYNPVERPDSSFGAAYFGGDKEDWDAYNSGTATGGGSMASWNSMLTAVRKGVSTNDAYQKLQGNNSDGTPNSAYTDWIDVENYITYLIANFFLGNTDWPHKNYYASINRVNPDGFKFFTWDAEWVMGIKSTLTQNMTGSSTGVCEPYKYLIKNSDFLQLFGDITHKAFFNGGPLYVDSTSPQWNSNYPERNRPAASYSALADSVERAVVGESARWGDVKSSTPYNLTHWRTQRDWILNTYMKDRASNVLSQFRSAGLYPTVVAPVFYIDGSYQHGGQTATGSQLSMTKTSGTIWYSLDGSDPRLPQSSSGSISPRSENPTGVSETAIEYTGPITLSKSIQVKSRVLNGTTWSALNEAVFAVGPVAESLRISEIMFHPLETTDSSEPNTEYIELKNTCLPAGMVGSQTINLNLVKFTKGIDFTFGDTELTPNGYILVVRDSNTFTAKYGQGLPIAGTYTGSLDNAGEKIELQDAACAVIHSFKYEDNWYDITDGTGFSLTVKDPVNIPSEPNSLSDKSLWRPSANIGGSPGSDDTGILPELGDIVINELLAHSHAGEPDWIELCNTTNDAINIGGWFLSDDLDNLTKYQINAGTSIPPGGYMVFYEDQHFNNLSDPGCAVPFALSGNGETLYLQSSSGGILTGYSESEKFDASETGVSMGKYLKSTVAYNFMALKTPTPGSANSYPLVGPVVINEIMYHPDGIDDAEYVELLNISSSPVVLYDSASGEPWRFTDDPDNPGIDFRFPTDSPVTLDAGEYLLLVKDSALYGSKYTAPAGVQIFSWGSGQLDNASEKVQLSKPGDVEDPAIDGLDTQGTRYWIRVDRVVYSDGGHPGGEAGSVDLWPVDADGLGKSLGRINADRYGNDPNNWQAATPTPGTVNP